MTNLPLDPKALEKARRTFDAIRGWRSSLEEEDAMRAAICAYLEAAPQPAARYAVAEYLAKVDGISLQRPKSTIIDRTAAENWRTYLGLADNILTVVQFAGSEQ